MAHSRRIHNEWASSLMKSWPLIFPFSAAAVAQPKQASFQGLGDLPGGIVLSQALEVSNDGSVVVGISNSANGSEAFRWKDGTLMGLGSLAGGGSFYSSATATNADGSIIVGFSKEAPNFSIAGFRWTEPTGMVGIGGRDCYDISLDGNVIVGSKYDSFICNEMEWLGGAEAAVWVGGSGPVGLGMLPDADISLAGCVSGNGNLIGGGCAFDACNNYTSTAVTWSGGAIAQAGAPIGGISDISPDGIAIVGVSGGAGFIRIGGTTTMLPGSMAAYAVSAGGLRAVGTTLTAPQTAMIWDATNGTRNLKTVLENDFGLNLAGWTLGQARGISGDGSVIVGYGTNPSGQQEAWIAHVPSLDADGDGLLDDWETKGIPYTDSSGNAQHYVLDIDGDDQSDADPNHKDLFVELDVMSGLSFPQNAKDAVEFAFDAAPITNPDGSDGIRLHIVVDDTTLPFQAVTPTPGNAFPADAASLRDQWFGTIGEHFDQPLREAKQKAYRYGLLMNKASTPIGGIAEIGGDDMVLFAGPYAPIDQAAVFMHEFGHMLGLRHGGGDDINGKPNYPSIMNYVLAYKSTSNASFWRLDFAREELAALDENNLNEQTPVGSSYYSNFQMPYFSIVSGVACFPPPMIGQPFVAHLSLDPSATTDYDLNCDDLGIGLAVDVNYLDSSGLPGMVNPSPGELLAGWNDWAHVQLPVNSGGGAFAGSVPPDELTEDQLEFMEKNFPIPPGTCLADLNDSRQVDVDDLLAVINEWGACINIAECPADIAPAIGDGNVDVDDLLTVINTWGACE